MTAVPAIVELRALTKNYRQGSLAVQALRGLDLTIGRGEFTALCGPSGSGKTTALNLIGALDRPTSGTVLLEGRDLGTLDRQALSRVRRDRIGFVFQAYNLMPVLTAYENAEIVLSLQGVAETERRDQVMAILKEVGLGEAERGPRRDLPLLHARPAGDGARPPRGQAGGRTGRERQHKDIGAAGETGSRPPVFPAAPVAVLYPDRGAFLPEASAGTSGVGGRDRQQIQPAVRGRLQPDFPQRQALEGPFPQPGRDRRRERCAVGIEIERFRDCVLDG